MKGRSLNGTDEQIKMQAVIRECERTGLEPDKVCKLYTGLTEEEYTSRPFNRVGYYQYLHQQKRFKNPIIDFWVL